MGLAPSRKSRSQSGLTRPENDLPGSSIAAFYYLVGGISLLGSMLALSNDAGGFAVVGFVGSVFVMLTGGIVQYLYDIRNILLRQIPQLSPSESESADGAIS
jgi:hypothetical protein